MNIFKIFGTIALDGKDQFNKDIDEATNKGSTLASKIGGGLKTAAKVGGAAITAAASGVAALTKASVDSFAEYEQLVGGVETLFKDSAGKIQDYADRAYLTAGLSANEYMSTVTSFSASLLQSLGGDTEKAADYADMAIRDMSDNANKMGTSMEMIQNAYQGFAKQNYTMLDNLKLGYGGTQAEMKRLIADAAKLDESIDANDMSFGNIVKSINAVQREMGILGATEDEAAGTISGSLAAVKAQWSNLLTAISQGDDWDIGIFIDNFVKTIEVAFANLQPIIEKALVGAVLLMEGLFPKIGEALPNLISTVMPSLLSSGFSLLMGLIDGIMDNLDALIEAAFQVIDMLLDGIIDNLPRIMTMGIELIGKLIVGIIQAIPSLVSKVPELIGALAQGFVDFQGKLVEIGINIVKSLWEGLKQMWKNVVSWAGNAIGNLFGGKNKVNVAVDGNVNGSHAGGLNYVPFNGYIAELHKGEMVVPADEARKLRNGTTEEKNIIINLTTTLDGKVIGETSYKYAQNMARAMGV